MNCAARAGCFIPRTFPTSKYHECGTTIVKTPDNQAFLISIALPRSCSSCDSNTHFRRTELSGTTMRDELIARGLYESVGRSLSLRSVLSLRVTGPGGWSGFRG